MDDLLGKPPMTQNVNKPLGHLSPSMMADDLKAINDYLTAVGVPIMNSASTQIGDIRNRLFILSVNYDVRLLEQNK